MRSGRREWLASRAGIPLQPAARRMPTLCATHLRDRRGRFREREEAPWPDSIKKRASIVASAVRCKASRPRSRSSCWSTARSMRQRACVGLRADLNRHARPSPGREGRRRGYLAAPLRRPHLDGVPARHDQWAAAGRTPARRRCLHGRRGGAVLMRKGSGCATPTRARGASPASRRHRVAPARHDRRGGSPESSTSFARA